MLLALYLFVKASRFLAKGNSDIRILKRLAHASERQMPELLWDALILVRENSGRARQPVGAKHLLRRHYQYAPLLGTLTARFIANPTHKKGALSAFFMGGVCLFPSTETLVKAVNSSG